MTNALAKQELVRLEGIIDRGLDTFIDVGKALAEIRAKQLYTEAGFKTWEAYCKERWGMSDRYANTTIESVRIVNLLGRNLGTNDPQFRLREWHIRPLQGPYLTDRQRILAWGEAKELAEQENEPLQARHVKYVVDHMFEGGQKLLPKVIDVQTTPLDRLTDAIKEASAALHSIGTTSNPSQYKRALAWAKQAEASIAELHRGATQLVKDLEKDMEGTK